jgi:VWFA-related protein
MIMRIAFAITLAFVISTAAPQARHAPQAPVFRAGIDVFAIEASVLDRDGKPIDDLTAQDFTVTVDGKARRVRAARFHHEDGGDVVTTAAVAPVPGPVTNSSDGGRIVVFVVDRDSIASGNEKVVFEAAATVLDGLSDGDAAGVLELPGSVTDLTRDHARVRAALMRVVGSRPAALMSRDFNITWEEALGYERRDPMTIARVVERECPSIKRTGLRDLCPPDLQTHAREMLHIGRIRTQSVLSNLTSLAKQLAPMRGAKQIVLLTSGFPFGQDLLPLFNQFTEQAAASQIVFYGVHLQQVGADVTARKTISSAYGGDDFASGVGNLASMTGGSFFMASGSGAGIFNRVRTEMNNFYELAVEMEPVDVSAEALEVEVKVTRPGAAVRNRRRVIPPARTAAASTDRLGELIRQPIDVGEIPLALSAYTMRGDEPSMLRTIVGIEAGSAMNNGPAEWAFAVYNEGNVVATGRQRLDGTAGPWIAALSAKLLPGRYRLRASILDAAGKAGVLERSLEVGLRGTATIQFSDLLVGVADQAGRLQPASRVTQGASMSALVEVISADPAALEQVRTVFEIVPGGSATPVKRFVMGARSGAVAAILTNQAEIATADLPPGRYTASATPMLGEQPLGRVSRVFEIVKP